MRDGGFVNLLKASPVWPTRAMNTPATPNRYKHHRFPGEIISHGVWLYDRFYLGYRDVEELLFERGVIVTNPATTFVTWVCSLADLTWHTSAQRVTRPCRGRMTPVKIERVGIGTPGLTPIRYGRLTCTRE